MNLRKVIDARIRRRAAGVDIAGDVNAVIAANVNEPGSSTLVSGKQTVVQRGLERSQTQEARMSEHETEPTRSPRRSSTARRPRSFRPARR